MIFPACLRQASDKALQNLGMSMMNSNDDAEQESAIPAGYLFLSQFITNDISDSSGEAVDKAVRNRRRTLDLDCVYGNGETPNLLRDGIYPDRMIVGKTSDSGAQGENRSLPNDLPRIVSGSQPGHALIGDPRNDENLGLAQTHLLFLKLHNRFIDTGMDFRQARKATTQHYQSTVINDYLKRILDPNVFNAVFRQPRYVCFSPSTQGLSLEFLLAVNHYSYSMICDCYEWNRFHSTGAEMGPVDLAQLYRLTERRGDLGGQPRLPTSWVIDWRKFYELRRDDRISSPNMTRKIDARMIEKLDRLIDFPSPPTAGPKRLAMKILRQAKRFNLPSGQIVVDILNERGLRLHKLDAAQLRIENKRLRENTPLWYYMLRESFVQQHGDRLGEVGSWLVADTFKRLILDSPNSVLNDTGFTPCADVLNGRKTLGMPAIVEFVGDIDPLADI